MSAPQRMAQTSFSTSSAAPEVTAELPILALILTRKLRPMMTGSSSGWLMLAGMMARPRAISERTNSGVTNSGISAPKLSPSAMRSRGLRQGLGAADVLAVCDVDHLLGDDAGAGVLVLGDVLALLADEEGAVGRAGRDEAVGGDVAVVLGADLAGGGGGEVAGGDPGGADLRQAGGQIDGDVGFGIGAGGVVEADGLLAGGGVEDDLAERDGDVGAAGRAAIGLAGPVDGAGGDGARLLLIGHACLPRWARTAEGRSVCGPVPTPA